MFYCTWPGWRAHQPLGDSLVSVLVFPLGLQMYVLLCLGVCGSGDSNSGPHAIQ